MLKTTKGEFEKCNQKITFFLNFLEKALLLINQLFKI